MKGKKTALLLVSLVFAATSLQLDIPEASANSVETYPAGAFSLGMGFGMTVAKKRFTNTFGAGTESIVDDYNVTIPGDLIDSSLKGSILGRTDIGLNSYGQEIDIKLGVGITDNLSVLMIIPIKHGFNDVSVGVHDSTIVLVRKQKVSWAKGSPAYPRTRRPDNPYDTYKDGDPMNTQDFRDAITCYDPTSPMCSFNYDQLVSFDRWGMGDMIVGARYKLHDRDWLRTGLTLFFKIPTGKPEDPDNLFDSDLGKGHLDMGLFLGFDVYPFKKLGPNPFENFFFNVTGGYTIQMPFTKERRMYTLNVDTETGKVRGQIPISMYWQKMDNYIKPGNNWDLWFGFTWNITPWLTFANDQYFYWKYQDDIRQGGAIPIPPGSDPLDPNFKAYQPEWYAQEFATDLSAINTTNSIGINTLDWVMKGKFPVPFAFSLFYTYTIAGKNVEQEHIFGGSLDLFATFDVIFGGGLPTEENKDGEKKEEKKEEKKDDAGGKTGAISFSGLF